MGTLVLWYILYSEDTSGIRLTNEIHWVSLKKLQKPLFSFSNASYFLRNWSPCWHICCSDTWGEERGVSFPGTVEVWKVCSCCDLPKNCVSLKKPDKNKIDRAVGKSLILVNKCNKISEGKNYHLTKVRKLEIQHSLDPIATKKKTRNNCPHNNVN